MAIVDDKRDCLTDKMLVGQIVAETDIELGRRRNRHCELQKGRHVLQRVS